MSDTETEVKMDIAVDKITLLCTSQNIAKKNGRPIQVECLFKLKNMIFLKGPFI